MARDSVLTRVATGAAVGGAIGGAVGELIALILCLVASFSLSQARHIFLFLLRLILCMLKLGVLNAGAVYGTYDAIRYKVCDSIPLFFK